MPNDQKEDTIPISHPRLQRVAAWIHYPFQLMDDVWDRVSTWYTQRFVEKNLTEKK